MIATRGFVRTPQSSHARLSHFPTDAEALRVGHRQIRLVLICVLVCRGYRIPCSDCSSFDLRISLMILPTSKPVFVPSIVLCCAPSIAAEPKLSNPLRAGWKSLKGNDPGIMWRATGKSRKPGRQGHRPFALALSTSTLCQWPAQPLES